MIIGGQLVVLKIAGIELDPVGDFTLREKGLKNEESETTRKKTYFTAKGIAGMISGQVANTTKLDRKTIRESIDVPVLAEEPNGMLWQGTMTYTADADTGVNDGTFQIEMLGDFKMLPS